MLIGVALGYVLSQIATRWRTTVWLPLVVRLVLFVTVVLLLARNFGPRAALIALVASVLTRALLSRRRVQPTE